MNRRTSAALTIVAVLAGGCGGAVAAKATTTTTTSTTTTTVAPTTMSTTTITTTTTTTTIAPVTTTTLPRFSWSVSPVTPAQLGKTWHAGCPVAPDALRMLTMSYWGFDGRPHTGEMVVNAGATTAVVQVFSTLYASRFPIEEMVPQSFYGGNDEAAAAADDTSGFNCRLAVTTGPPQWSEHAYGLAIDVNDVQNPYLLGSTVYPPAGAAYLDRGDVRPGMAYWGGVLVDAFASVGWQWGGRWTVGTDYQHFSANGG